MAKQVRVMRMSVEQPLWRALTGYRVLTMLYAVGLFATEYDEFDRPGIAIAYYVVLCLWTLATLPRVQNAAACTKRFLAVDRMGDLEILAFEVPDEQFGERRVILDQQHLGSCHAQFSACAPPRSRSGRVWPVAA